MLLTLNQTWLTVKNAFSPNFHTEWSNSCLQDLANQTLLPLALPNYTANNFHCDWARWANQATQARQLFTSFCPRGLRRTGTAFFRVSHVCWVHALYEGYKSLCFHHVYIATADNLHGRTTFRAIDILARNIIIISTAIIWQPGEYHLVNQCTQSEVHKMNKCTVVGYPNSEHRM